MNEDKEREAFYEWEGQNEVCAMEAWLERARRADGGKGEAVARVNDEGFIVETGDFPLAPGMQLFAAPQAANKEN